MVQNVHGTFLSEKINKIRWRPESFNNSHSFITGSWDNDQNNIKLWSFEEGNDDSDIYPFVVENYSFEGDVTEVKFINSDYCVVSSSLGSVHFLKLTTTLTGDIQIVRQKCWSNIHKFKNEEPSLCTSFTNYDNDIVTAGEDGTINVLNVNSDDIQLKIEEADSCSINCVTFVKSNEILTGNSRGQMKIWDLRVKENKPVNSFMLSNEYVATTCLTYHPNQRHIVVAGDEDGSLIVWDLRQSKNSPNLLSAHAESVSEIQYHPDHPNQLFSCSLSGELWHWITTKPDSQEKLLNISITDNPWLTKEGIKNKFEVFMLMPKLHKAINSIDLSRNRVLCGCDNEAIYIINNVNICN